MDREVAPAGAAFFAWRVRGIYACRVLAIVAAVAVFFVTPTSIRTQVLWSVVPVAGFVLLWVGTLGSSIVISASNSSRASKRVYQIAGVGAVLLGILCAPALIMGQWHNAAAFGDASFDVFVNNSGLLLYAGLVVRIVVAVVLIITCIRSTRRSLIDLRNSPERVAKVFS